MSRRHHGPDHGSPLESIAHYATSSIVRQLGNLATALVRPMVLSPEHYGLWNLFKTLPNYAQHLDLGVRTAARYDIPANQAQGADADNKDIEKTILLTALASNLALCTGLAAYGLLAPVTMAERVGFVFVALWIMVLWLHDHYLTLLKAYQWFKLISRQNYLAIVLNLLTLPLLFLYDIYGLYASMLLNALLVLHYLRRRYTPSRGGRFSWPLLRALLHKGLPVMAFAMTFLLLRTVDRFLIIGFLGNEMLGYYGIAIMLLTFIMNVPTATREVLEPRLMQDLHGEHILKNYRDYFAEPVQSTAVFMGLLSGPVFHLAPAVVALLLPRYTPGTEAMQIVCLSGYFMALSYIARGLVVALNRQKLAVVLGLGATAVNVVASLAALRMGLSIEGVAAASVLALGLQFEALRRLIQGCVPGSKSVGTGVTVVAAACFLLMLLFGLGLAWGLRALNWPEPVAILVGGAVYYAAFFLFIQALAHRFPPLAHFTAGSLLRRTRSKLRKSPPRGKG